MGINLMIVDQDMENLELRTEFEVDLLYHGASLLWVPGNFNHIHSRWCIMAPFSISWDFNQ
jgi:hypothetical protein